MNSVKLIKQIDGQFELVINNRVVRRDTTSATNELALAGANTFLQSSDGTNYLDGNVQDNTSLEISYVTTPTPANFDGTNQFRITFVDKSAGQSTF